ncbi:envelope glycoprotein N [Falconid herpesvirus 1]|uniref:Envelope glycoprotein N n=2 Tax=Columbid alphaherpesvirus 1 TaxID=93386 RepID=A0A068EPA5_9ALPH|nr:envelope glycoprotein N [Falconid herpesvirus 1]YP_009352960.1 envelope glycoprotein N [Columbid alphaherpesvirus 1]AID52756.1 envelope glycoprotein N [Falconid herpesvirus 1]ARD71377.1 envelope glycoprotein N [Columbid alphaherpesvirus 1]
MDLRLALKVLICAICVALTIATNGRRDTVAATGNDFWSPHCSAVGVSIAFSSTFSIMFYLGLLTVIVSLLAGSYHACFRLFAKEMFTQAW